jgi:subtilisin family serine protease
MNKIGAATAALLCGVACGGTDSVQGQVNQLQTIDTAVAAGEAQQIPQASVAAKSLRDRVSRLHLGDDLVTVVVEFSGQPVALARAQALAADRLVTPDEKQVITDELSAQHAQARPQIEALGGEVLSTFRYALNGIKVRIPASRIGALTLLPGAVAVKHVGTYEMVNATSVPFIGAPAVWQGCAGGFGNCGEGIKVAIIDTGIDYTHANFGGSGNPADFAAASLVSTAPANPAFFGPTAPRVKGGTDLVGDAYNANDPTSVPQPDPNPLDCNGHGSHTAGTAAGSGVTADGHTFTGPYDTAHDNGTTTVANFKVGPGVAPKADIYAVRVFGCNGSTNVVTEALEWSVENEMQVVSMSLGSNFGNSESADAEASTNAANAGIIVVAASGNAGNFPYITSSPAAGDKAISVAAMDSHLTFPGANLTLAPSGTTISVQNSNNQTVPGGTLTVHVIPNAAGEPAGIGGIGLGCLDSDYPDATGTSQIAVAARGTCARIYRAQAAFHHGYKAVALVNNGAGFGVFEGDIPSCIPGATPDNANGRPCDPGETPVLVTIPMFGVTGVNSSTLSADATALKGSTSLTAAANAGVANPTGGQIASFSSRGPLLGYNADGFKSPSGTLKPNITGPGVSILSTGMGTGTGGVVESGTSMATPHVAGSAALALKAHPKWSPDDVRIAVEETADPTQVVGYTPRSAGSGVVQPLAASRTSVVARGDTGPEANVSLGVLEFQDDFSALHVIKVKNVEKTAATFNVSATAVSGAAAHTVAVTPSTISVPGKSTVEVGVTVSIPATASGLDSTAFREVGGVVTLSPTGGTNGGATVNLPYFAVPRARADVGAAVITPFSRKFPSTTALVQNASAKVNGKADIYSLGGAGTTKGNLGSHAVRALGVKSAVSGSDRLLTFAFNTNKPNSTYDAGNISYQVDITLPGNTSGVPDFSVFTEDVGLATGTGANNGQIGVIVVNNNTGAGVIRFLATAPTDSSLVLMPTLASDIGVTAGSPRFTYQGTAFFGADDSSPTNLITDSTNTAVFNAFSPSLTAAVTSPAGGTLPITLAPGTGATISLTIDPIEWAQTPTDGVMVVTRENPNSGDHGEALLFKIRPQ